MEEELTNDGDDNFRAFIGPPFHMSFPPVQIRLASWFPPAQHKDVPG